MSQTEKKLIQSIRKAFTLLELIGRRDELRIAEMVRELKWKKSTVHRIASSLEQLGYLKQNPQTSKYRLSLKLFSLGNLAKTNVNLHAAAFPFLQKLQGDTGESIYLGVIDHDEVLYLEHVPSKHVLQPIVQVGSRAPLHCTAIGKVLLAYSPTVELQRMLRLGLKKFTPNTLTSIRELNAELSEVRRKGFALDKEEYHIGIRSIAVPVTDDVGHAIAAVSIAGPTVRLDVQSFNKMAGLLKHTADLIRASLKA